MYTAAFQINRDICWIESKAVHISVGFNQKVIQEYGVHKIIISMTKL